MFVTTSEFGHGAYATRRFEIGEVIEFGFSSKFLPGNVNGNIWEMVFTWQEGNKDLTANNPSVREYEGFQHWANCQVLAFFQSNYLNVFTCLFHSVFNFDIGRFSVFQHRTSG